MKLTLMQFNLENLFSRYRLLDTPAQGRTTTVSPVGITSIEYDGRPVSEAVTQVQRNNTAQAILDCQPDILAAEEVDNLWTLRAFNDEYLGGYFGTMILVEGNDPRGIDVALCIRKGCEAKVTAVRSHMDDLLASASTEGAVERYYSSSRNEVVVKNALFSRDCLEVDVDFSGKSLTFLVNHFKAQSDGKADEALRNQQAARVAEIVKQVRSRKRLPIVMGDLNEDWSHKGKESLKPIKDLVGKVLADPFAADKDPWTHFYSVTKETTRLDYVLVDRSLRVASKKVFRKGISLRCTTAGERYATIGQVGTEASDHCAVVVTLDLR